MENNKYKLVQIISHTDSVVQPVTEDNKPYLDKLCTLEDDRITYAIYENKGDNDNEMWDEYANYAENFSKAVREYRRLMAAPQDIYELTILLVPDLMCPECEMEKITKKITELGGLVNSVEDEGCKRLPYSVRGYEEAHYYYLTIQAPQLVATRAIAPYLDVDDSVLRYLLVKEDTRRHQI